MSHKPLLSSQVTQAAARARQSKKPSLHVDEIPLTGASPSPVPDPHDPNYDSEDSNLEGFVFVQAPISDTPIASQVQAYRAQVTDLVNELFTSDDTEDFAKSVSELKAPALLYEAVRRLLSLAMERNAKEKEIASRALAFLVTSGVVPSADVQKAFERLFELSADMELDIPQAKDYIARFLARAVADEILPPSFLRDATSSPIIDQAKNLLSARHSSARLSRVWGPTALIGNSNEELKSEIKLLLTEYLASGDMDEAIECVKRLDAPHFHHEVVKRAIVLALDGKPRQRAMMSALIAELHNRGVMSSLQIELGFKRLDEELDDLELDTPGAARVIAVFKDQAIGDGVLTMGRV